MADKIMDRIAKYLALAENEGATEAERERAMERATRLSQAHAIDLAIARAHNVKKSEASKPERRSHRVAAESRKKVTTSDGYTDSRSMEGANAPLMDLFLAIAEVYDLKCIISGGNTAVHAMGYPEDHEMVERLFSIISVQMVAEADRLLKDKANMRRVSAPKRKRMPIPEDERDWGGWDTKGQQYDLEPGLPALDRRVMDDAGYQKSWESRASKDENREHPPPSFRLEPVLDDDGEPVMEMKWEAVTDARTWRKNHYLGFIQDMRARLKRERRQAMLDAGIDSDDMSSEKGIALVDKAEQVKQAHDADIEERYVYTTASGEQKSSLGSYEGTTVKRLDPDAIEAGSRSAQTAVTGAERDLKEG